MSSLLKRLNRTVGVAGATETMVRPESGFADRLKGYAARATQRAQAETLNTSGAPRTLEDALAGETFQTPRGEGYRIRVVYPDAERHGDDALGDWRGSPTSHLSLVTGDARLDGFTIDQALFLDIEATGLEHGAGTYAFIVGLGWIEDGAVVLEQLILRRPSDEAALLYRLVELLDRHAYLVSFNGKSYDLSVLQARLVLSRVWSEQVCAVKLRPHLDLLHLSQNIHRGRWADTRLGTVEREILGLVRVDDMPGFMVPSTWYHWLRTDDAGPLGEAVRHNRDDVLSMVGLAAHLARVSVGPEAPNAPPLADRDPGVLANLGRLYARRGAVADGFLFMDTARRRGGLTEPVARALWKPLAHAARLLKETAVEGIALREWVGDGPEDWRRWTALAIHLERRANALGDALDAARSAARLNASEEATHRRIARLERRLAGS